MATFTCRAVPGPAIEGPYAGGTVGTTAYTATVALNLVYRTASSAVAITAAAGVPFGIPRAIAVEFEADTGGRSSLGNCPSCACVAGLGLTWSATLTHE